MWSLAFFIYLVANPLRFQPEFQQPNLNARCIDINFYVLKLESKFHSLERVSGTKLFLQAEEQI